MIPDALLAKELVLVNILGQKRRMPYGEMVRMAPHRSTFFYLALVTAALTLFDPTGYRDTLTIAESALVWTVGVLAVTFCYNVVLFLWVALNTRLGLGLVLFPVVALLSTCPTVLAMDLCHALFAAEPFSLDASLRKAPYFFLVIETFDVLYFTFALPVIRAHAIVPKKTDSGRFVQLAGQKFAVDSLQWATSQDHYLNISSGGETHMLLARMGDLTNQLKPSDGIQTHRSWWVSAVAATEITKIGGSEFMDIGEGTRIPVARGRSGEVQGWLAQRGQPDTTPPVND